jgi:HEPN domain-containing protein
VTNESLARSYLRKATDRMKVLEVLFSEEGYSDVVRKAQELVELALKGMLRVVGIEPLKFHDVGGFLIKHGNRFPVEIGNQVEALAMISKKLRKDRELAFYGDVDFIPTEEYSRKDAEEAIQGAKQVLSVATTVVECF